VKTTFYTDGKQFYDDTIGLLEKHELQNNLLIGNAAYACDFMRDEDVFACVSDESIKLICTFTPPYNLCLYAVDNVLDIAVVDCLISALLERKIAIPCVLGDKALSRLFAVRYAEKALLKANQGTAMRIYRLDKVSADLPTIPGVFRQATEADMRFMGEWFFSFAVECGVDQVGNIHDETAKALNAIKSGRCFVWDDDGAVATAKNDKRIRNAACVNGVYTPPHFRKKGYATACVAALSKKLLDDGFDYCYLFTDLANPTSNSIYQKIGYNPICDYDEWVFGNR
jgi:predicted GNAT family acetyltransferase